MLNPNIFRTTTFRLTVAFGGTLTAIIILLLGLVYVQTVVFLQRRVDAILASDIAALESHGPKGIFFALAQEAARDPLMGGGVFSRHGDLLGGDEIVAPSRLKIGGRAQEFVFQSRKSPQMALADRLPWGDVLVVHRDVSQLIEIRWIVIRALLCSGVAIATLGFLLAVALSRRPLKRVQAVSEASHAISSGNLAIRLPFDGSGDELDELARIVNGMMDDVERLVVQAQTVGEGVAHELRTPLTRLRATLDHAAQDPETTARGRLLLEHCVTQTDILIARFRALLRIAAVEAMSRRSGIELISLSKIVEQIGELYMALALDRSITLKLFVAPEITVRGDPELLSEAISNLLDNALKFTAGGGEVEVQLVQVAGGSTLSVRDNGVGIPEAERPFVAKRFYRSTHSAHVPGHGLGLSLVLAVADLHGFTLSIEDGEPGAVVTIHCPSLQPNVSV